MKIFIDTANLEKIKEISSWGIVEGCTTNPKIISKEEDANFEERIKKILEIVDGPVSVEVTTNDPEKMIEEAEKYNKWGENVVVKIPMGPSGLKAVKILSEKGIKTNVTACMSMSQAVLAAKAGATYASLFMGRICDMGYDAKEVIRETVEVFEEFDYDTKIIIGSIRRVRDINNAALAGAHIVTIPPKFFPKMASNPKTEETIQEFLEFWDEFKGKKK